MKVLHLPVSQSAGFDTAPASDQDSVMPVDLHRYRDGRLERVADVMAVEEPLLLHVAGLEPIGFSRTPGDDENLVAGHLLSRGLIRRHSDIRSMHVTPCRGGTVVRVELAEQDNLHPIGLGISESGSLHVEQFFAMRRLFEKCQGLFRNTGATHAAALFSMDGRLLAFGEDVGRHNAFDKVLGRALNQDRVQEARIAMLSSRLALELAEKALATGIGILCGFSVATSSAVEFARTRGLTLVGRLRDTTMNVYSGHWRITD